MALEFVNVHISRLIVHEVFGRAPGAAAKPPAISRHCSQIEGQARATFVDRLTKALGADSNCVEMQISNDAPDSVFQLAAALLPITEDAAFSEASGAIAVRLHQAQASAAIPGGIVIVFTGTVGTQDLRFTVIIKAEVQEGFRRRIEGRQITLELLRDLFLTPQQKLYKIGIFVETEHSDDDGRSPGDFEVHVYDSNMTHSENANAAKYFSETFLGCVIPQSAKHMTKKFFDLTREWLTAADMIDTGRRVDLKGALYTYLKVARATTLSIADFAQHYLQGPERSRYATFMREKEYPATAVPKDIAMIRNQLKRVKLRFTSDVTIAAPSDEFNDRVKVEQEQENYTIVRIRGRVEAR